MTDGGRTARMTRELYPMPEDVEQALAQHGLMAAYRERPMYQQNDYVGWIGRAKRMATREKRLAQMLEELRGGRVYMGMAWRGGAAAPGE